LANSKCGIQQGIPISRNTPILIPIHRQLQRLRADRLDEPVRLVSRRPPGVLQGPHLVNDSYTNSLHGFNDLLNVHSDITGDDGDLTWISRTDMNGLPSVSPSGFSAPWYDLDGILYRYGTVASITIGFTSGRDAIINNKTPLVVAYASDSHITVAYVWPS